jgi:uncharacterized protein (TIGR00266 family)
MPLHYKILGETIELVEITLDPGQQVRAEAGALIYMSDTIRMSTGISGGLFKGLKRKIAGEQFFMTTFSNTGDDRGVVGFGSYYPGKTVAIDMRMYSGTFFCQQRAFLCSDATVDISMAFVKRIGAGLFGGEGFILQKLVGSGLAFLHAGGTVIRRELLPGESLKVDTGCLLGFSSTIDYDITIVTGITNPLFGGEGFFLAQLTGPGEVLLQSLPFARLADNIASAITANPKKPRKFG